MGLFEGNVSWSILKSLFLFKQSSMYVAELSFLIWSYLQKYIFKLP